MAHPVVLCYHAVSDTWEDGLAVTNADFDHHIRTMLRRGYVSIAADDVLTANGKTFHVTFDDAFSNIREALERLVSFGVSASVFACTAYADEGRRLEVERLARSQSGHTTTMTWVQLRELVAMGIEVGSHTISHPRLTELSDDELRVELRGSKERLEDELRRPCDFLAYPFGDQDARVRAATRAAGYVAGFADYQPFDAFAVPRVGLYRRDKARRAELKLSPLGQLIATRRFKRR